MRLALPLLALTLLAGCSSTGPTAEEAVRPLRFAVIPAPTLGGEPDEEGWTPEDRLLEAVTLLSVTDGAQDYVLVPGPLLAPGLEGDARAQALQALHGALGSLAWPVVVAPAASDPAAEVEAALAGLTERAPPEGARLRPVALGPDGSPPEGASSDARTEVALLSGAPPAAAFPLTVGVGEAVGLVRDGGRAALTLPPLARAPHAMALCAVSPEGLIEVTLRLAADGADATPEEVAPVRVDLP